METRDIVAIFVALSREQGEALNRRETRKYNRIFDQILAIRQELESRAGDERNALIPLLDHMNLQVKMNAAFAVLPIAKEAAFATLKWVAESRYMPFAAYARGSVEAIEEDDFPRGSNPNSIHRHAYLANLKKGESGPER